MEDQARSEEAWREDVEGESSPSPRDLLDYKLGELTIPQEGWEIPDLERVFSAKKTQKWKRQCIRRLVWELQAEITELNQANAILNTVVDSLEAREEQEEESGIILV